MICKHCGVELDKQYHFCPECGNPIEEVTRQNTSAERQEAWDYCQECGHRVPANTKYCDNCGAEIKNMIPTIGTNLRSMPGTETTEEPVNVAPVQAAPLKMVEPQEPVEPVSRSTTPADQLKQAENEGLGMKWYKFLIYFSLFASAFLNFVNGILYISGMIYDIAGSAPGFDSMSQAVYAAYPSLRIADLITGVLYIAVGIFSLVVRSQLAKFKKPAPNSLLVLYAAVLVITVVYTVFVSAVTGVGILSDPTLISNIVTSLAMILLNHIYFKKRKHLFVN